MKQFWSKTSTLIITAIFCCTLWGSAYPCIKVGLSPVLHRLRRRSRTAVFRRLPFRAGGNPGDSGGQSAAEETAFTGAIRLEAHRCTGPVPDNPAIYLLLYGSGPRLGGALLHHQRDRRLRGDPAGGVHVPAGENDAKKIHRLLPGVFRGAPGGDRRSDGEFRLCLERGGVHPPFRVRLLHGVDFD